MSRRDKNNIQLIEKPFAICLYKQVITLLGYILMTNVANAACTPKPDCASIGYTETSCETQSVKCPFDATKLYCLPCDSSFKYSCNGTGYSNGEGNSCSGKYTKCICSNGYEWNGNICEEKQNCTVGMIYYSDKSCSEEVDVSKTAIGVVVKDNELVMSQRSNSAIDWANSSVDVSGVTNYTSSSDAKKDYNGKANTLAIVSAYSSETASENAAIYCNSYSTEGTNAGDWYLPAAGEIYDYYYGGGTNYSKINATITNLGWESFSKYDRFWTSSEHTSAVALLVRLSTGDVEGESKNVGFDITCLLGI